MKTHSFRGRRGFTLVEMLVVITIIAIVAAITIPTIVAIIRVSKNGALSVQIARIAQAIEQYKNERGEYFPDFSDRNAVIAHLVTAYSRNAENLTSSNSTTYWYREVAGRQRTDPRHPLNLDPAEALVFWLSLTRNDVRLPLSSTTAEDKVYYEFEENRLFDVDNDGWPEYVPQYLDGAPLVYFQWRSYLVSRYPAATNQTDPATVDANMPPLSPLRAGYHAIHGVARPYMSNNAPQFVEPEKYQIVCAGLDNHYGNRAWDLSPAASDGTYGSPANVPTDRHYKQFNSGGLYDLVNSMLVGLGYSEGDRDNIASFSDSQTLEDALP